MSQMNDVGQSGKPDSGTGVGSQAMEAVQQRAEVAKDEMSHVAHSAQDEVRHLADEARSQLRGRVDEQGAQFNEAVRGFGQQLSTMGGNADDPEQPAARVVRQIGDRVTGAADRFDERGVEGMVEDVKRYARQHPGQFIAIAATAGFVVGRLIRNVDTGAITHQMAEGGQGADQEPRPSFGEGPPVLDLTEGAGQPSTLGGVSSGGSRAGIAGEEVGTW